MSTWSVHHERQKLLLFWEYDGIGRWTASVDGASYTIQQTTVTSQNFSGMVYYLSRKTKRRFRLGGADSLHKAQQTALADFRRKRQSAP